MELEIDVIRALCGGKSVKWTAHILARLQERGIEINDVRNCIATGRIIEQYPDDYPFPSCLLLGHSANGRVLHAVVGVGQGFLWLITAYHPDPEKWECNFSRRRE